MKKNSFFDITFLKIFEKNGRSAHNLLNIAIFLRTGKMRKNTKKMVKKMQKNAKNDTFLKKFLCKKITLFFKDMFFGPISGKSIKDFFEKSQFRHFLKNYFFRKKWKNENFQKNEKNFFKYAKNA